MMATEDDLFGLNLGLFDDDFFGMPMEPLTDFDSVEFEESEIDAFLEQFEAADGFDLSDEPELDLESTIPKAELQLVNLNMNSSHLNMNNNNKNLQNKNISKSPTKTTGTTKTTAASNSNNAALPVQRKSSNNHHNNNNKSSSSSNSIEIGNVTIRISSSKAKPVKQGLGMLSRNQTLLPKPKRKKQGISLLAKPLKPKKQIVNRSERISPTRFATYFYEDHNYCPTPMSSARMKNNHPDEHISMTENISEKFNDCEDIEFHSFNCFDLLNERSNISIETEVIMSFDFEEILNGDCYESSSNGDNQCESISEGETINSDDNADANQLLVTANEVVTLSKDINNIASTNNTEARSGVKPPKVFRMRKISTRSSVSSSRSSSVSSVSSDCSCSSCSSRSESPESSSRKSIENSDDISNIESDFERKGFLPRKTKKNKQKKNKQFLSSPGFSKSPSRRSEQKSDDYKSWSYERRKERLKEVEERRIVYVGNIPDDTTKNDLRRWFTKFGAITQVSVHFRDYGSNYAFVTFQRRCDAYEAVQRGNGDQNHPKFDLSFGGRRNFCKNHYQDLDFVEREKDKNLSSMDFDSLLRTTKTKFRK